MLPGAAGLESARPYAHRGQPLSYARGLTGAFCTSGNEGYPPGTKGVGQDEEEPPEQIVTLLRQVEVATVNGKSPPQACKDAAMTEQTSYRWWKEYGGLKLAQAKRLKELEKENSRLTRGVAELSLEKVKLASPAGFEPALPA